MKIFFTSFFSAKALALALFFGAPMVGTGQVLFSQDFSSGTVLSTYVGTGANQLDFIGVNPSGGSSTYVTAAGRLTLQRNTNNVGFAKTTNFTPTASPSVLKIKFKLSVPFGSAMTGGTAGTFYVGSGLDALASTPNELPSSGSRHSQLGIRILASGNFILRDMGLFTNSPVYAGEQVVTWYINNSDATINYINPSGSATSLDNDQSHVWVGTTRVDFTNPTTMAVNSTIQATTVSQTLTNFKFLFNNASGNSAIAIDDLEISTGVNVLPISLLSFNANKAGTVNKLAWATATETNNKGFDIERQTAKGEWETLGFVKGIGSAATYSFEDKTPLSISYYRLRQMDFDGKETLSKVVSVSQSTKGTIKISPNPVSDKVRIVLSENIDLESTIITVYDLMGKQVMTEKTTADALELDMSSLAKGIYLIKIDTNRSSYTEKIIRQ